jgi:hypothetical protein
MRSAFYLAFFFPTHWPNTFEPSFALRITERTILIHSVAACVDGGAGTSSMTPFRTGDANVSHSSWAIRTAHITPHGMEICAALWIDNQALLLAVSCAVIASTPFEHCRIIDRITKHPRIARAAPIWSRLRAKPTIVSEAGWT